MDVRSDFPMFQTEYIYFDNGATTFKPKQVIEAMNDYYNNFSVNAHRGDYYLSLKVDEAYENVRQKVADFIGVPNPKNIIFTSGTTESLNMIVLNYLEKILLENDEILTTKAEHASLLLPCFELAKKNHVNVKYIPLNENKTISLEDVKNQITSKTKVIILSHITNIVGDIRPIKEITEYAHNKGILVVIDGAQSVPHIKVNVTELDVDFLAFSAHKMYGPTGVGVLYGKEKYLELMAPHNYGGGMNLDFTSLLDVELKSLPARLEAGTPNIAGVIGLGSAIDYINKVGINQISDTEFYLKKYAVKKMKSIPNIEIYNENTQGSIISFNIKGIFSQDVAIYLSKYNICIRAGNHCSKVLKEETGIKNTCRVSLSFYNTEEEIDRLVEVLSNPNILSESIM